jgi:hypothetical protein
MLNTSLRLCRGDNLVFHSINMLSNHFRGF